MKLDKEKERGDLEKEREDLLIFMKTNIQPELLESIEIVNLAGQPKEEEIKTNISHKGANYANEK